MSLLRRSWAPTLLLTLERRARPRARRRPRRRRMCLSQGRRARAAVPHR